MSLHFRLADRAHALAISIAWFAAPMAHAAVCYVDAHAVGPVHDGQSWATAFTDLRSALADFPPLGCIGVGTDIWVKAGSYRPSATDRAASFYVQYNQKVYGGFAGTETNLAQRNVAANPTILSGDIDGDDSDVADPLGVDRDVSSNNAGNSIHVVTLEAHGNPITNNVVLDGFIITAGNADNGPFVSGVCGGGLYCNAEGTGITCSPTLSNLTFSGNSAGQGGAVCNDADGGGVSSPALINIHFSGNRATNLGGAVYNGGESGGTSSPTFANITFSGNSASQGGAIYNDGRIGGVSSPQLLNVTFSGNSAGFNGGAMFNDGSNAGRSNPLVLSTTFSGNAASWGGALYNDGQSTATLSNTILSDNVASQAGPHVYNRDGGTAQIYYSVVHGGVDGCPTGGDAANTCAAGVIYADPLLGSLAHYGGAMPTMLPAAGSPAIDAGTSGFCPSVDERGQPRNDGHCDIGAVERQALEDFIFIDGFDG